MKTYGDGDGHDHDDDLHIRTAEQVQKCKHVRMPLYTLYLCCGFILARVRAVYGSIT